jgi:two-component system C4-dicarboxylate transport response regulator DctD
VLGLPGERLTRGRGTGDAQSLPRSLPQQVEAYERAVVMEMLRRHQGDQSATAQALSIPRQTLHDKLRKLSITPDALK